MEHSGGLPRGAGIPRSPEGCARPRWEEGGGLWSEGTEDAKAWSEQGGPLRDWVGFHVAETQGLKGRGRGGERGLRPRLRAVSGAQAAGVAWPPQSSARGGSGDGNVRTDRHLESEAADQRPEQRWLEAGGTEDTWEPILRATPQLAASLNPFVSDCESDSGEDLCGIRERREEK